jgi:Family of unknown function (DUF6390)
MNTAERPGVLRAGRPPSLFEYGTSGVTDAGLVELAKAFAGAWPYLEPTGCGTSLLDTISASQIGGSMEDRFRSRTGHQLSHLVEGVVAGGVPHHSFHVFEVYPWVGLLRDDRKDPPALNVLDCCRIRWGTVISVKGDEAVVKTRLLEWDGRYLALGEPVLETAT